MAGRRIKTGTPAVDRSLEDIWRRLDALERRGQGATVVVNNSSTIIGPSTPESLSVTYTGSGSGTVATRLWMSIGSGTVVNTLASSSGWPVPSGISRATGLVVGIRTAGTGGAIVTYRLTVGTNTTETDTALLVQVPGTFSGSVIATANIAVNPGDVLRLVLNKSAALAAQQVNIVAIVTLEK